MLMHIVLHLLPDEARVESFWCATFGSIHLDRTGSRLRPEVAWVEGWEAHNSTPHDFTHSWAR